MTLYYGRHKVKDYDVWRPVFDADQPRINEIGAKALNVMRSTNDPNEVHLIFEIADMNAFMGAMQDPAMQEAMKNGGVLEAPVLYKLEELRP